MIFRIGRKSFVKDMLPVLFASTLALLQSACVADATLSSLISAAPASFDQVSPYIQANNVATFVLSGTCKPQDAFILKARIQGQSSDTKLSDVACSQDGTFSVSQDLSAISDGNVEISLHDAVTDKKVNEVVVEKDTVPPTTTLLTPPPALNNLTSIVSGVSTTDTASYSFKFSTVGSVDCALDSGYSAYIPVATSMNENIAMMPDGSVTLCLRGQDAAGNKQTSATVYTWTKDTSVATATLAGLPVTDTNVAAQTATVGGAGVVNYKYKFGLTSLINCSNSSGYGSATPVATPINVTASSDGAYTLCVLGANYLGTWQSLASATTSSWNYDSTAPVLAITSPSAGSYLTPSNQASFAVTSSCSENSRAVQFTANSAVDASTSSVSGTCLVGTVSVNFNLSTFPEGVIHLSSSQTDVAGNTGTSATVNVTKDTTAPTLGGSLTHAAYSNSTTATPSMSWSTATDGGSGIQKYQVAVGTTSGGAQVLTWTDVGNVTTYQINGLTLTNGTVYYPQVRAVDNAGQVSSSVISSGFTVDNAGPDVSGLTLTVAATDSWSLTDSPTLTWNSATDSGSGVSNYQIAIGTAAGLSDVKAWTSVGNVNTTTVTGLTLTPATTYYASLRALDAAGNTSSVVNGNNGWLVNKELWVTDGSVETIVKSGTRIYFGGYFYNVGPWTGGAVPVSIADGSLQWPNTSNRSRVNGSVFSVLADGSGGFYIGGSFTKVGEVARTNLAHILADGSVDPNFNPSTDYTVLTMLLSGTTLYLGGNFTQINGLTRNYIGAVSATDGSIVVNFDPNANSNVQCLALSGTTLYMGGGFTSVGGAGKFYIAAVSTVDGSVNPGFTASADGYVNSFILSGSILYVGGSFYHVNGTSRNGLASISATTGALNSFNPNLNMFGNVYSMQLSGTTLYLGGNFSSIGGVSRGNLAAVSTVDGSLISSFHPTANFTVQSIVLSGTSLYVGGQFSVLNGVTRNGVGVVSTTDGSLISGFNPNTNGGVYSMALSGANLYMGGTFSSIGGVARSNLAAISTDGTLVSGFSPNPNSMVYSLLVSGSNLYVGGMFSSIGGAVRNSLAAISLVDGTAVAGFSANSNSTVYSLATDGTNLYFGGAFTTVGGVARNRLAAVSLADGTLVAGFNPNVNSTVAAVALSGSNVYFGGSFTTVGGVARNYLGAVLKADGSLVSGFNPNPSATVNSLLLSGTTLYVGGGFTTIGGGSQAKLAAISSVDGSLISSFAPSIDGYPMSMSISGGYLYMAGSFTTIGGVSQWYLGSVSATDGSFNSAFRPDYGGFSVDSLVIDGSSVYFPGPSSPVNINTGARIPASN